jgi:hypothetical protein
MSVRGLGVFRGRFPFPDPLGRPDPRGPGCSPTLFADQIHVAVAAADPLCRPGPHTSSPLLTHFADQIHIPSPHADPLCRPDPRSWTKTSDQTN